MSKFEENTKASFAKVKADMQYLHQVIEKLNSNQKILINYVIELKGINKEACKIATSSKLVASKNSNKVHESNCPFSKNIRNDGKVFYNSIQEATSKGLEPCQCVVA